MKYELDGRVEASLREVAVDIPSLKGGSAIGELGLSLNLTNDLPLSLDVGVQGYTGQR